MHDKGSEIKNFNESLNNQKKDNQHFHADWKNHCFQIMEILIQKDGTKLFTLVDDGCSHFEQIKSEIQEGEKYPNPQEFFKDINLTFDSVIRRNKENKPVFSEALNVKKVFLKEFKTRQIITKK